VEGSSVEVLAEEISAVADSEVDSFVVVDVGSLDSVPLDSPVGGQFCYHLTKNAE